MQHKYITFTNIFCFFNVIIQIISIDIMHVVL